jgi:prevent-host-death family protein
MKQVGIFEAKTRFSRLVDEVERGEDIVITRHGRPVARLVPAPQVNPDAVERRRKALMELREMARKRGTKISIEEIKGWIDEGRP